MIRQDAEMPTTRFCALLGIPRRSYARWQARGHRHGGQAPVKGPWPAPVVDWLEPVAAKYAADWPGWGHRRFTGCCGPTAISRARRCAGAAPPRTAPAGRLHRRTPGTGHHHAEVLALKGDTYLAQGPRPRPRPHSHGQRLIKMAGEGQLFNRRKGVKLRLPSTSITRVPNWNHVVWSATSGHRNSGSCVVAAPRPRAIWLPGGVANRGAGAPSYPPGTWDAEMGTWVGRCLWARSPFRRRRRHNPARPRPELDRLNRRGEGAPGMGRRRRPEHPRETRRSRLLPAFSRFHALVNQPAGLLTGSPVASPTPS